MTNVKKSIYAAVCIALCVVLPMAFHSIPNAGSIFLPMYIPVLLCGLLCGWSFGLACGIIGPLLSTLFTGMPPIPVLPGMLVELAVNGFITGLLMSAVHTKRIYADLYISLVGAMLVSRVIAGIAKALIFAPGQVTIAAWVTGSFVTCLPGIIIQLALIPSIVFALERAKLIPMRYPRINRNQQMSA